jgi:hypothetical protein
MCGKAFGCRFNLTIANEGATMSDFQIGIVRCERSKRTSKHLSPGRKTSDDF